MSQFSSPAAGPSRSVPPSPAGVGPSPIEGIALVAHFTRPAGMRFEATSLPGHLLHIMVKGQVRQRCNGREYLLGARTAFWYHQDETVTGDVIAPWEFYSINFIAGDLPPPELSARVLSVAWPRALRLCRHLHAQWIRTDETPERRLLALHAALQELLLCLSPRQDQLRMDPRGRLWWLLEGRVREQLHHRLDLDGLCALIGASRAAVDRSCRHATALSPQRRLKQVRLSLAHGLLSRADLSIGAIAKLVGYGRIHEFSRDYRQAFGHPPSHDRGLADAVGS
jgi:AraC-like DNA-binding protein